MIYPVFCSRVNARFCMLNIKSRYPVQNYIIVPRHREASRLRLMDSTLLKSSSRRAISLRGRSSFFFTLRRFYLRDFTKHAEIDEISIYTYIPTRSADEISFISWRLSYCSWNWFGNSRRERLNERYDGGLARRNCTHAFTHTKFI